jgi:hypothetical protein
MPHLRRIKRSKGMKSRYLLATALTVLICTGSARRSAPQAADRFVYVCNPLVLSKIKKVDLILEAINKEAQTEGLTEEAVQTDIELKLRLAGIEAGAFPPAENLRDNIPTLDVSVNIVKQLPSHLYLFGIEVQLHESEQFSSVRNPHLKIGGVITWQKSIYGTVGENNLQRVREIIKDRIDLFCNDYLKANPKN